MWDKFSVHKRNMSPCLSWHDGPRWEHKLAGMFKFCAITEHWWGFSSTVCADDDVRRRQEAHSAPVCARFDLDLGTWIFTETLTWERFSAQLKAKNATSLFSSLLLSAKQPFVSDKSSNTPVLLLGAGTSALFNAFKTSFWVQEPNPSLTILGNSQHAAYPQTKVLGRMKGEWWCLLKPLRRLLAEPQIASLLFTVQPSNVDEAAHQFSPTLMKPLCNYAAFPSFLLKRCPCPTS